MAKSWMVVGHAERDIPAGAVVEAEPGTGRVRPAQMPPDRAVARGAARLAGAPRLMHAAAGDPELEAATDAVLARLGEPAGWPAVSQGDDERSVMAEETLENLLLQLRIAVQAGYGLPGVTAPRLYCHPSVEYRLLACPPGPYAHDAIGREGYLLAVTGGVPVEADRSMEPGAWRLVLSEGRLERGSET